MIVVGLATTWQQTLLIRLSTSLTTLPTTTTQCLHVVGVTLTTTTLAGMVGSMTNFVHPQQDFHLPSNILRPLSVFVFPALVEELVWRGALLPPIISGDPQTQQQPQFLYNVAFVVLLAHVLIHPLLGATVWPRGKVIFQDPRFLALAFLVLGGSTVSYFVSGGSVWAAALTHGVPVALWRDFGGGEELLLTNTWTAQKKREKKNRSVAQAEGKTGDIRKLY